MKRLRKFARLSADDRRLVIRTTILMSGLRLGLCLLPFRRLIARCEQKQPPPHDAISPERVVWAVQAASRYVPRATCLVQALTAKVLLESAGLPADVHLGVAKTREQGLEAHAWVEFQGQVVIGGDLTSYTRLPAWKAKSS